MSKDPAFLFYSSDFMMGVSDLTMEERGQYITLLCLQHQKGHLRPKSVSIAAPNVSQDVMAKFSKDKNGFFFNERLEIEREKRSSHTEKQRQRAIDGWKKRRGNATAYAVALPLENENENENEDRVKDVNQNEKKPQLIFPWDTEVFMQAWNLWKKFRKEQHNFGYKGVISEQAALKRLANLSNGNQDLGIKIIEQSIAGSYKGFFEIKQNSHVRGINQYQQDFAKEYAAKILRDAAGGSQD